MVQNAQMLNPRTALRASTLFLFLACNTQAQQLPPAITADPAPDKEHPAGMEAPDITSHGARLNAVLFLASGAEPHPTVLLLHGFPGNEKNLDLAYVLRRAGWNVLFPHYRGSWGSSGNFSFTNAMEDTQVAVDFLRDPANVKKYRIDPQRIVLIGHSMGGFLAAYATAHDPNISAAAIISAWNIGPAVMRTASSGPSDSFKGASVRLAGTTPEGMLAEVKTNAAKWNYVDYAGMLKTRPMLILESSDGNVADNQAIAEALRKAGNAHVTEKHFETDHSFSDRRIALQVAILEWLQSLPAPAVK
jgi:pimeloyl-ACP methyl ester carboxylesterase